MIRLLAAVTAAALAVACVSIYPWLLDAALERFGARGTAAALAVLTALTLPLRARFGAAPPVLGVGLAALLLGAAVTGAPLALRLVPAWIHAGLAWICFASLRGGRSLIETGARFLVPEAPDFITGYCRVVTALWGGFFALCAVAIGALALAGEAEAWRRVSGRTVWGVMAALTALEFFVRKTWFRYYFRGGPFDRFWSRLFPAERTERGRRSAEAIRVYRERLSTGAGRPTDARS